MLISDRVAAVADIADEFEQAVASLGWTGGAVELLDQLATGGALAYLRNADNGGAFGLLHAVTSPLACELVLPWLADEDRDAALGYVWQAAAALHVAYDIDRNTSVPTDAPLSTDVLVERALASGDEHAIKLTEAALRSFGRTGSPAVLLAAGRRLPASLRRTARGPPRQVLSVDCAEWTTAHSEEPASKSVPSASGR